MPWYKVTLSDDEIATGKGMALQQEFNRIYLANGAPKGAAMLDSEFFSDDNFFFFSPEAVRIASALIASYAGVECPAPRSSEVDLLVGEVTRRGIPFSAEN